MINLTGVFKVLDNDEFGYGKVAKNIGASLNSLDINSNIEICLNIPPYAFNFDDSYKIGFTTWESTEIPDQWIEHLNKLDEIWTASHFISNVYKKYTNTPIYIFNHGLDKEYITKKRIKKNTKTILFIGDELRSNEDLVVEAYKQMNINKTHRLIIKRKRPGTIIGYPGITTIESLYNKDELINLMYSADVLVYPTSGEGFGLVGIEAIGTGMPIISTTEWSEYKDLITVPINSLLSESKWPHTHNGKMFNPTVEDIKDSIQNWINNYEHYIDIAYDNGIKAHQLFSWNNINNDIKNRVLEINTKQQN